MIIRNILALSLIFTCSAAGAQDLKAWGQSATNGYNECSFAASSALMFGDEAHYAGTKACVEKVTAKVKNDFGAVAPRAGSVAPRLKDYYASWIAAMQALPTLQYGTKNNADRSYQETRQRLSEMWARIEIDAGL